ncbi:hypothetical protein CEXT_396951 [Caerostris extrusa]|uniref:Uncharacterized protein n=1 Tax=Caerostris extrusa TaxID=172846 RepID=A0AAV4Q817_CAEEX|nr:hypothetical protein CEXT_396951 [Caerostris extrusa]
MQTYVWQSWTAYLDASDVVCRTHLIINPFTQFSLAQEGRPPLTDDFSHEADPSFCEAGTNSRRNLVNRWCRSFPTGARQPDDATEKTFFLGAEGYVDVIKGRGASQFTTRLPIPWGVFAFEKWVKEEVFVKEFSAQRAECHVWLLARLCGAELTPEKTFGSLGLRFKGKLFNDEVSISVQEKFDKWNLLILKRMTLRKEYHEQRAAFDDMVVIVNREMAFDQ